MLSFFVSYMPEKMTDGGVEVRLAVHDTNEHHSLPASSLQSVPLMVMSSRVTNALPIILMTATVALSSLSTTIRCKFALIGTGISFSFWP